MHAWVKDHEIKGETGSLLLVYVQPGASKTAWKGEFLSTPVRLKLSVSAPPTEGEANEMVIEFIAESLGISKSRIHFISGQTSRQKDLWISGLDSLTVAIRLEV